MTKKSESHVDIEAHAAFVVGMIIPDMSEHYELCISCFGKEIIRQIEHAMRAFDDVDDKVGVTEGNA